MLNTIEDVENVLLLMCLQAFDRCGKAWAVYETIFSNDVDALLQARKELSTAMRVALMRQALLLGYVNQGTMI